MKIHRLKTSTTLTVALATLALGSLTLASAGQAQEELHKTFPLDKTGQVHLDNINGTVRVATWDQDQVKLDAIKKAKNQADLDLVKIEIDSNPASLRIHTKYPDSKKHKNNSTSVDYTLTVPKSCQLDKICTVNGAVEIEGARGKVVANSVNGAVTATGLVGPADLSTVNGSVKATIVSLQHEASLHSVNGALTITLPSDVKANLSCSTVNGGITTDFPVQVSKAFPGARHLNGKVGEGGPQVKASTVNGGIRIHRAANLEAESR